MNSTPIDLTGKGDRYLGKSVRHFWDTLKFMLRISVQTACGNEYVLENLPRPHYRHSKEQNTGC